MTQSDYLTMNYLTTNYLSTALEAAAKAVQIVRDGAEGTLDIRSKGRPNNIVTQVDVASEKVIRETILAAFPDHSILGEEDGLVGDGPYRWIIDPLDGTANFARGLPHYCVSVGLEHDGEGLVGVVANPLTGDVYRAERGAGCLKNDRPVGVSGCRTVAKAYLSMGFGPDEAALWDTLLRRAHTLRRLGATALELAWVAEGKLDAYLGFGQGAWDLAAGRVLVTEAGGAVRLFDDGKSCIAASSEELLEELEALLAASAT